MLNVVLVVASLIIGFLLGLLVRRKPTSSTNPADYPPPGEIKEVIEDEVDRGIEVHELNKRADEALEDIDKLLEEESQ